MADSVTTTISDWRFGEQHVQINLNSSDFVSSQTTLMCAGPPKLASIGDITGGTPVVAMGVVENLSIQQNQQLQRVYELGSARSYLIPGVVMGGFNVGRLFINGPSLLRTLYAVYGDDSALSSFLHKLPGYSTDTMGMPVFSTDMNVEGTPGYGDLFINLVSEMFKRPIGVAVYLEDRLENMIGAFYIEYAMISAHQMGFNAGATVVAETATFEFDRVVPIDVRSLTSPSYIESF